MKHHLVGQLLGVGRVALTPVVAHSVGKDVSSAVESGAGNCSPNGRIALQTMFRVLVPEVESAVTTGGAEGTVNRMEGDSIERINVVDVALIGRGLTVTFEAEVGARVLIFDILDGTATFDTTNGKPGGINETVDCPRLPLEGRLHGFVEFGGAIEVNDVDVPVRRTDNEELVLHVHGVHSLLTFERGNRGGLPQVPIFDSLIPRAGDEKRGVSRGVWNHITASNRSIVSRDLHWSGSAGSKVEHPGSFIGTSPDDFGPILRTPTSQLNQTRRACRNLQPTGAQQQLNTGASCSKSAFPSLCPCSLIS